MVSHPKVEKPSEKWMLLDPQITHLPIFVEKKTSGRQPLPPPRPYAWSSSQILGGIYIYTGWWFQPL